MMSKRLITVLFASLAVLGVAAAPAQAAELRTDVKIVKPLGWDWGAKPLGWDWGS